MYYPVLTFSVWDFCEGERTFLLPDSFFWQASFILVYPEYNITAGHWPFFYQLKNGQPNTTLVGMKLSIVVVIGILSIKQLTEFDIGCSWLPVSYFVLCLYTSVLYMYYKLLLTNTQSDTHTHTHTNLCMYTHVCTLAHNSHRCVSMTRVIKQKVTVGKPERLYGQWPIATASMCCIPKETRLLKKKKGKWGFLIKQKSIALISRR